MAFHLKGKEEKFFNILNNHVTLCHDAAVVMEQAFKNELPKEEALRVINQKEKEADQLVNQTIEQLRSTFITPMDREDIQQLIEQLDITLDSMKDIMDKMCMYNVGQPTKGAIRLIEIVQKCLKHITKSISYMYA